MGLTIPFLSQCFLVGVLMMKILSMVSYAALPAFRFFLRVNSMMMKLASSPVPIAITGVASPVFGDAVEVGVVGVATGGVVGVFSSVIVTVISPSSGTVKV